MIDTHAHLTMCSQPMGELLKNAQSADITDIIQVAVDIESALENLDLSQKYPMIHPTIGIHPLYSEGFQKVSMIEPLLKEHKGKWVALGEIGLDYKMDTVDKKAQRHVFEEQLDLATKHDLPIIIHNRKADDDILAIMTQFPSIKAVLHCYSSNMEFAEKIMTTNITFSFTGMITFSKKGKVINTIKNLPLDKIMLETDCPYLTPKPYLGQENCPAFLGAIAETIAMAKDLPIEKVKQQTTENAKAFFNLP